MVGLAVIVAVAVAVVVAVAVGSMLVGIEVAIAVQVGLGEVKVLLAKGDAIGVLALGCVWQPNRHTLSKQKVAKRRVMVIFRAFKLF